MEPKERPILFSGPMVCAILQGLKTQTRRIVKPQPREITVSGAHLEGLWTCKGSIEYRVTPRTAKNIAEACPYGQPGDRLWVRESYYQRGHWEPVSGVKTKSGRMKWRFVAADDVIQFDAPSEHRKGRHHRDPATVAWHRRLARFMPRAASRITLEVISVRAEPLQAISEEDARAEGVCAVELPGALDDVPLDKPRERFGVLWSKINGPESWDANPWVWAVTFKRLEVSRG
jgi:hypothetical protein